MTFEEVDSQFLLKIGEESGNSRETLSQRLDRINESYWQICQETGATYVPPVTVSLSADTNQYRLYTLLGLSTGEEVFNIHRATYQGRRLNRWSKQAVDEQNELRDAAGGGMARAYAFWEVYSADDGDKQTYIAYFPYVSSDDSTNFTISYFKRPVKPTTGNYTTLYPEFGGEFHWLIAELAALKYLRDRGDSKYSLVRWNDVWSEIRKMKDHYLHMIHVGERVSSPLGDRALPFDWRYLGVRS